MEKTCCEASLFFVMPSITIVFLISFGLLDRCSFRTLFELEGTLRTRNFLVCFGTAGRRRVF